MIVLIETAIQPPKQIDHSDSSDRIWMNRFVTWCIHNGHRVTLRPIVETCG